MAEFSNSKSMLDVLVQIVRCPTGSAPVSPPRAPTPACLNVVGAQGTTRLDRFQVPEPWRGDLASAPLLFVSSNPGWDRHDDSPTAARSEAELYRYFTTDGFPPEFPRNRNKSGCPNPRAVPFWAAIRNRAAELYDLPRAAIMPGHHFALTEVVHCKSATEAVAVTAANECARRHMKEIARLSAAKVVVVLGDVAARTLGIDTEPSATARDWHGRERIFAWLPHPNARTNRTFRIYAEADMSLLRKRLKP